MKNITIAFLLTLLISTFAYAQHDGRDKKTPEERAEMLTSRLEKELSLSPEQVQKVKAINLSSAEKTTAARKEAGQERENFREQKMKIEKQRDDDLKAVLTPEQFTKYHQWVEEKHGKMKKGGEKRSNS